MNFLNIYSSKKNKNKNRESQFRTGLGHISDKRIFVLDQVGTPLEEPEFQFKSKLKPVEEKARNSLGPSENKVRNHFGPVEDNSGLNEDYVKQI